MSLAYRFRRALLLAAFATLPASAARAQPLSTATAQVSELIGLSPAELRLRLGIRPADHDYLDEVSLTADGERRVLKARDLGMPGGTCAPSALILVAEVAGGARHDHPRFVFQNGKFIQLLPLSDNAGLPQTSEVEVRCIKPSPMESPVRAGLTLALYSPLIVVDVLTRLPRIFTREAAMSALTKLRLGETPPGGLEAYRARLPSSVTASDLDADAVQLTFDLGESPISRTPALVRVTVRDGRVVDISKDGGNFHVCVLTPERSMRCGLPN